MNNTITIIGGMGPQASLELHRLIIDKSTRKNTESDKFPDILHASIAVRDFISSSKETRQAIDEINNTCSQLPMASSTAIGLACNTAHLLLNDLPALQSDKFVSMIDGVCEVAASMSCSTVGLLATPFTLQSKLYEIPLRQAGLEVLRPNDSKLPEIAEIIRSLIEGERPENLRPRLTVLANELKTRGAEVLILGCTELPIIGIDTNLPVVSSLDVLATKLIEMHKRTEVV